MPSISPLFFKAFLSLSCVFRAVLLAFETGLWTTAHYSTSSVFPVRVILRLTRPRLLQAGKPQAPTFTIYSDALGVVLVKPTPPPWSRNMTWCCTEGTQTFNTLYCRKHNRAKRGAHCTKLSWIKASTSFMLFCLAEYLKSVLFSAWHPTLTQNTKLWTLSSNTKIFA